MEVIQNSSRVPPAHRKSIQKKSPVEEMAKSESPTSIFRLDEPADSYHPTLQEHRFLNKQAEFVKEMQTMVHFDADVIRSLLLIYRKLLNYFETETMTGAQFTGILNSTFDMFDDVMNQRIVLSFNKTGQTISMTLWLKVLSLFLRGSLLEKIDFCYEIYDIRNRGFIGKDIMMKFLRGSILTPQGHDDDEAVIDIVDIVFKKMDIDRDGKVSYDDYKKTVLLQPSLLEFLGQCLPDFRTCTKILTTLTTKFSIDTPLNPE